MFILSQCIIAAGFLLMLINFVRCAVHVFFSKNVLLKNDKKKIVLTIVVLALMLASCVLYGYTYSIYYLSNWVGLLILTGILLCTILLSWFFSQITGIRERCREILEALVGIIEIGDPNLEGHSLYVHNLTMLMYENLPLTKKTAINPSNLHYASLLLDIGKLGIPRRIMDKTGKLTEEEWEIVRRHPEIGVKILAPMHSFDPISTWIKYHHERVDGTGYYHLQGEQIPLASRMIAVADTYSAITMERSYKPSMKHDDALAELKLAAGTQLDEEMVTLFCHIPYTDIQKALNDVKTKMERYSEEGFRE
ncbi:MAG: HD domain-containing protein [Treponema sp.]|nr:HD domain-containing protein [Treponema sp.]